MPILSQAGVAIHIECKAMHRICLVGVVDRKVGFHGGAVHLRCSARRGKAHTGLFESNAADFHGATAVCVGANNAPHNPTNCSPVKKQLTID
eukprot:1325489-Prymnesium_polylepis.1